MTWRLALLFVISGGIGFAGAALLEPSKPPLPERQHHQIWCTDPNYRVLIWCESKLRDA